MNKQTMIPEEKKAFNKEFWLFLLSSILIALSACLGNVVDSIIVGHLIGEDGVSAINLTKPVTQFMFTLSMLVATGAAMLVGMELGKKNTEGASAIYSLSFYASVIIGVLLTVLGLVMPETIAGWLCKDEGLFPLANDYLRIVLLGAPAYMIFWCINMMIGVDGSPKLVSVAIVIDNVVNLCLDIVFIKYCGWGITGSSVATVIGHLVGIAIMCRHYFYKDNHLHLRINVQHQTSNLFRNILSQGLPLAMASICLTALMYCANSIVLHSMGRVGIFAFSVCMNLLYIYNLFLSGTCRTMQSLGSIQVGKGDNEAFKMVIRKSFRFITIAMLITCVGIWLFPEEVTRFFGADEQDLIDESVRALRIFALSFMPFCYIYVLMIVYKLYGYHKIALFISMALSLTVIPVLWAMAKWAPEQLWYSYLIAYAMEAALIALCHRLAHAQFELRGT